MFFRTKKSGQRVYLQIVESYREGAKVRQRVIATLGRLDELQTSGRLESLLLSGGRFAERLLALSAYRDGELEEVSSRRFGPVAIFERLWRESGCPEVIETLLDARQFSFAVERMIFLTVLHRLLVSGSDRSAQGWVRDYAVTGCDALELHHAYRAMGWLGEPLGEAEQEGATPFAPRCTKDRIEELLFERNADLFTELELVFYDTTSIYFEGEGGETLGRYGFSKDHRPDRKQVVVGAVLDQKGRPLCCEIWPGNTSDVTTLIPVAQRLRKRFGVGRICVVADRGMISTETLAWLEREDWAYILGVRMRRSKEVREEVLGRTLAFDEVQPETTDPDHRHRTPLKVAEVVIEQRRYIVCENETQARKDKADREAILEGLEAKLKQGDKALVGNKGYRKYLKGEGAKFSIDREKVESEARFDGKWVLRTNTELTPSEIALKYKRLWQVEAIFRSAKSLLDTRPIYHHNDATIRGHIFCSFLALVLRHQLLERLEQAGLELEWDQILRDLDVVEEVEVVHQGKRFVLRTTLQGCANDLFRAVGIRVPPMVRQLDNRTD